VLTPLTSVDVCAVALTAMQCSRLFIDNLWVVECHAETTTYKMDVVYAIETSDFLWQMDGEATIQNKRLKAGNVKYQMRWKIPDGYKPIVVDGDVCFEWSKQTIVAQWGWDLGVAETSVKPIDWSIELFPVGDINEDGEVDGEDRGVLFSDWNTNNQRSDLNKDGVVNGVDLGIMNTQWGWKRPQ
jgi:hypothetical protein